MATFHEQLKKAQKLTPQRISKELFIFIKSNEDRYFDLNVRQLEEGTNSKGGVLQNKDKRFSGTYTQLTEDIAAAENPILPKKAGELYNFGWSGDFLKSFVSNIKGASLEIYNTGEGASDKKAFFDGFEHLYGLTDEALQLEIEQHLTPFIIETYRKQLDL